METKIALACAVGAFLLTAQAGAEESLADRSSLSYEENVTINLACAAANKVGGSAYDDCAERQLKMLSSHPTPDLAGASAPRAKAVRAACEDYRRSGVADYNDCLTRALAKLAPAPQPAAVDRPVASQPMPRAESQTKPRTAHRETPPTVMKGSTARPQKAAHALRPAESGALACKPMSRQASGAPSNGSRQWLVCRTAAAGKGAAAL